MMEVTKHSKGFGRKGLFGAIALSAMLAFGVVNAQDAPKDGRGGKRAERRAEMMNLTPEQRADKRIEHMKKQLSLTDQQGQQIKAVFVANEAKLKQDRVEMKSATTDAAKQAAREKMQADHKAVQAQVAQYLNADQKAKLAEFQSKHGGEGRGGARKEFKKDMKEKWQKLSPEERNALKEKFKAEHGKK